MAGVLSSASPRSRERSIRPITSDRVLRETLKDALGQSHSSISRLQGEAAEKAAELERETTRNQRLVLERDQAEAKAQRLLDELDILRRKHRPGVTGTGSRAGVKRVSFSPDSTATSTVSEENELRVRNRQLRESLSKNEGELRRLQAVNDSLAAQLQRFSESDRQSKGGSVQAPLARLSSSGSGVDSGTETTSAEEDEVFGSSTGHLSVLLERVRLADNCKDLKACGQDVADEVRRLTGGRFGALERSLKSELEAKKRALGRAKDAEEEAEDLRLFYSLNRSLSQEEQLKLELLRRNEQVAGDHQVVEEQLLRLRRENFELGDRLLVAQRERNDAVEAAEKARGECQRWQQQAERLERLVVVLRKRLGLTNSPSVASVASPSTPAAASTPLQPSESAHSITSLASPATLAAPVHRATTPVHAPGGSAPASGSARRGDTLPRRHQSQKAKSPLQPSPMNPDKSFANTSHV